MERGDRGGIALLMVLLSGCGSASSEQQSGQVSAQLPAYPTAPLPSAKPSAEPSSASATATATATASVAPVAVVAQVAQQANAPTEARFLPVDKKCTRDTDCAVTRYGVSERLYCCDGCDGVAGSKSWVQRADAACQAYHRGSAQHPCPARDCGPQNPPRCHEGLCEIVPARP